MNEEFAQDCVHERLGPPAVPLHLHDHKMAPDVGSRHRSEESLTLGFLMVHLIKLIARIENPNAVERSCRPSRLENRVPHLVPHRKAKATISLAVGAAQVARHLECHSAIT